MNKKFTGLMVGDNFAMYSVPKGAIAYRCC